MAHESNNENLVVVVATFADEERADTALEDLKLLDSGGAIDIVDAAVVVHEQSGKVHFKETTDPSGKTWAKRGAIAGGLIGLIFPPSIIAGAVMTGGAGAIWGAIRDKGFKDDELKAVGESLTPGSSAIIAVVAESALDRVDNALMGYERLTRHAMNADASATVLAAAAPSPA